MLKIFWIFLSHLDFILCSSSLGSALVPVPGGIRTVETVFTLSNMVSSQCWGLSTGQPRLHDETYLKKEGCILAHNSFENNGHHVGEGMAVRAWGMTTLRPVRRQRDEWLQSASFFLLPFNYVQKLGLGVLSPTFRVGFFTRPNYLETPSQTCPGVYLLGTPKDANLHSHLQLSLWHHCGILAYAVWSCLKLSRPCLPRRGAHYFQMNCEPKILTLSLCF